MSDVDENRCGVCDDHARVQVLIEQSSLGTDEAKAVRESVPNEVGIAIATAAKYLRRAKDAEAVVERVQALADEADSRRLTCASDPDCPCAYKDCYECGKWHNCTHTPWAGIRAAIDGDA